MERTYHERQA
jgi:hypothetical protein